MNNMLNGGYFKFVQLVFYCKFWFGDSKKKEMKIYFINWYNFQRKEN